MDLEVSQNRGPLGARKLCGDYEGIMGSECRLTLWEFSEGTLLGTPNREPQEYSRYIIGIYLPGSLYIPLYSCRILGVPSTVSLYRDPLVSRLRL